MPREFELRDGERTRARLLWTSALRSIAEAEAPTGSWTFKRSGFLAPRVTVRDSSSNSNVATLMLTWRGGGVLHGPEDRSYRWANSSFWRSEWSLMDSAGKPLIAMSPRAFRCNPAGEVNVQPSAIALPDLDLLLLLGWYLIVMIMDDSAVIATAGA
jgi:hypothetical protein